MVRVRGAIGAFLIAGLSFGCVDDGQDEELPEVSAGPTGIAVRVDFHGGTDVSALAFTVDRCATQETVVREIHSLEELVLPGLMSGTSNRPLDDGTRHNVAEYFTPLEAGCYDVTVQPMAEKGRNSEQCSSASASEIVVVEPMTTEIFLVSTCGR